MSADRATISLVDITTPDITLGGITAYSLNPGLNTLIAAGGGVVDPTFSALMTAGTVFSFTSRDIGTLLAAAGIAGAEATTVVAFLQNLAAYGTRGGASLHTKITIGKAFLVPRTLTATAGGEATISYDVIAISADGTTAPIAVLASQTLTEGGGTSAAFTAGPCSINGTALTVASITVDFGLDVRPVIDDANVYPTSAYIANRRPTISISSPDMAALATITAAGVVQSATDSVVYFAQLEEGATRKAGSTHISLTVDDGRIEIGSLSGSDGEPVGSEIVIKPISDGTAAIMAVDVAAALP